MPVPVSATWTAGGRELDGVPEQVGDHLGDAGTVGVHRQRARGQPRLELDAAALEGRPVVLDGLPGELDEIEPRPLQLDLVARDAGDVEQVVDHARELADLAVDDVPRPLRGVGPRGVLDHVQAAADRRQRVAQLVRQHGDELALAPIGLAQLVDELALRRDVVAHDEQLVHLAGRSGHRHHRPEADHAGRPGHRHRQLVALTLAGGDGALDVELERLGDRFRPDLLRVLAQDLGERQPADRRQRRVDVEHALIAAVEREVERHVLDGAAEALLALAQLLLEQLERARVRPGVGVLLHLDHVSPPVVDSLTVHEQTNLEHEAAGSHNKKRARAAASWSASDHARSRSWLDTLLARAIPHDARGGRGRRVGGRR